MAKIISISDIHGETPDIPECDILLIAGDICPGGYDMKRQPIVQAKWLINVFKPWLEQIPAKHVVGTWGNHDWVGQVAPHLVPEMRWTLLVDAYTEINGFKVFGMPWSLPFYEWAYNLPEEEIARKCKYIPDDTDIIVCHGPPWGFGDLAPKKITAANEEQWPGSGEHTGSKSFTRRILEIKPQLVVFGHIHEGRGVYHSGDIILANVTRNNRYFDVEYPPMEFDLTARQK